MEAEKLEDSYTSVEAMLYQWFEERNLYPGELGRGDVQDLAVRVSSQIAPFRNFFRAHQGWDGYGDLEQYRKAAEKAEKE